VCPSSFHRVVTIRQTLFEFVGTLPDFGSASFLVLAAKALTDIIQGSF
jgi:hypothetical protein